MSATPKVVRGIVNLEMGGRYPYVSFQAGAIPVGKRVVILPAADYDAMVTRPPLTTGRRVMRESVPYYVCAKHGGVLPDRFCCSCEAERPGSSRTSYQGRFIPGVGIPGARYASPLPPDGRDSRSRRRAKRAK